MATLVCFHAHPDDEAIATGGTMAQAARDGHRVILVLGTSGEEGEPLPGVLDPGEELGSRRAVETQQAADLLGVARVEFLGYRDSGMMGQPTNDHPDCFWQADIDVAARRFADLLADEDIATLTIYDDHGGYGHPDHIQVNRVGLRAAEVMGISDVYMATMNRDEIREHFAEMEEVRDHLDEERAEMIDADSFGMPQAELTHCVSVAEFTDLKRKAMLAHASQIGDDSFFLAMPEEAFEAAFGMEWFAKVGQEPSGRFGSAII
jgi:LmbE family N-acetylglucosaminyl deacetylase